MSNSEPRNANPGARECATDVQNLVPRPFDESPVLRTLFGTEARLQAMAGDERAALVSSDAILEFLKQKLVELAKQGGGAALSWVTAQLLKAFGMGGGPSDVEQIKEMLQTVLDNQKKMLEGLAHILDEIQFQHLVTRSYESVDRITTMHRSLTNLSQVVDPTQRAREAQRLKDAILEPNTGILFDLGIIGDVMLGKDPMGHSSPMINLFVDRWYPLYAARQLDDDCPLSTYGEQLEEWLRGVFLIQYMGLAAWANARIANGDFEVLQIEIAHVTEQMEEQKKMLADAIPEWTRTLPQALWDGRWYVVRGCDLQNGKIDRSQVMYGSTDTGYIPLDSTVQFRDRHPNNPDEEWRFESAGQNDTFYLYKRTYAWYVTIDTFIMGYENRRIIIWSQEKRMKLRLVMAPTNDPAVPPATPRKDRYMPALGFVPSGRYLTWTRGGDNVVRPGAAKDAVRVQIEPAGH